MGGNQPSTARDGYIAGADPIPSFVETGILDPHPRQLVDRLLYARALLQASPVLMPRFLLGDCAAAHHIVLASAEVGVAAAERLLTLGFRVEPWTDPHGIRFFLSSSHGKAEIHALLAAITSVVRELSAIESPALSRGLRIRIRGSRPPW
jgi:hypothetical protein